MLETNVRAYPSYLLARLAFHMPKLIVAPHKKAILVTGDTRECKDQLKGLGGGWNRALGGWCFPGTKQDELLAALRAESTIELTVHDTAAAPAATASSSRRRRV